MPCFLLCRASKQAAQMEALQWPPWCLLHQWDHKFTAEKEKTACSLLQAFAASLSRGALTCPVRPWSAWPGGSAPGPAAHPVAPAACLRGYVWHLSKAFVW